MKKDFFPPSVQIKTATYSIGLRGIPVNPVIDDGLLLPVHIFCPGRDSVQPATLLGVNYHLEKKEKKKKTNEC